MLVILSGIAVFYIAGEMPMLVTFLTGFAVLLSSLALKAILDHLDTVKALRDDIGAWTELYDFMKSSHRKACADLKKANSRARDFEIQVNDADYKIADFNDLIDSNAKKHDAEIAELLCEIAKLKKYKSDALAYAGDKQEEIAKLKQIIKDNDDAFVLDQELAAVNEQLENTSRELRDEMLRYQGLLQSERDLKKDIADMQDMHDEDRQYIDRLEKFNAGMINMLVSGISEMEESGFGGSWEIGRAMGHSAVESGIHRAGEITQMFDHAPVWSEAICEGFSVGVEDHLDSLTASGKAKIKLAGLPGNYAGIDKGRIC